MPRFAYRLREGITTGRLRCTKCQAIKLVAEFRLRPRGGWRSHCRDCEGGRHRGNDGRKLVTLRMSPADIDYLMDNLVPDSVPRSRPQCVAYVIAQAIAAHRKQATVHKVAACNSNRTRMMAGK